MLKRCIYCGVRRKSTSHCPKCGNEYRELIAVDKLPFVPIDSSVAEEYLRALEDSDINMSLSDFKAITAAVRSGSLHVAEALYDGYEQRFIGDTGYRYSIKIKSTSGDPVDVEIDAIGVASNLPEGNVNSKLHVFRIPVKSKHEYYVSIINPDESMTDELLRTIRYLGNSHYKRTCAGLADAIFGV